MAYKTLYSSIMNPSIRASRTTAIRALVLTMAAAVLAWALYVAGRYGELLHAVRNDVWVGSNEQVVLSRLLTVAAIAVLGLGALIAKRKLAAIRAGEGPRSRLVGSVALFTNVMVIVAAGLAAFVVLVLSLGGLFSIEEDPVPGARVVNIYVPIVLYTTLVVGLILFAFVFSPAPSREAPTEEQTAEIDEPERQPEASPTRQRTTALAYATPIIAAAVALLLGLIVYDLTRTMLEAWIWVLILVIVAAGVFAGTVLARRSEDASSPAPGIVTGAKYLNFVLTILFAVFASGLSLGYSTAAVYALNIAPSLSVYAYDDSEEFVDPGEGLVELREPLFDIWGYDLDSGSEVVVTLEPGGENVLSIPVDRNRWANGEGELPDGLEPGDYELHARALAPDDVPVEVSLRITVTASGGVVFPDGTDSYFETDGDRLLPITAGWVFGDLLPAGVLMLLGIAVTAGTITTRNRDV